MVKLIQICVFVCIAVLCLNAIFPVDCATMFLDKLSISKRSTSEVCKEGNPCGWAVYDSTLDSKPIRFYMKNSCACPSDIKCIKTNEDLSTTTYVYRCNYTDTKTDTKIA